MTWDDDDSDDVLIIIIIIIITCEKRNNNNSIHLFTCLTTAKYGQLRNSNNNNNNNNRICLLIAVAISSDRNVIQESENKLKYKNLSIEIQRMWNMKCFVIPVIIGATGIITGRLKKYLETIPGKHSIDSLQKKQLC
jgi:hypothetical protein